MVACLSLCICYLIKLTKDLGWPFTVSGDNGQTFYPLLLISKEDPARVISGHFKSPLNLAIHQTNGPPHRK